MKKSKRAYLIIVIVFLVGIGLILYPTISDYVNSMHQTKAIASYVEAVESMGPDQSEIILENARKYNAEIRGKSEVVLNDVEMDNYMSQLNLGINGAMGYIDIPDIKVSLPIYHTTEDEILQIGVGHVEWSSLPVGGADTHCVLSGHRGLPSATLFTNLDQLAEGELFMLHVLNETLTYEIDQILIVEPQDISALNIIKGEDLCTLVTCTPYGINTHRLLVRGHRVDNRGDYPTVSVVSEALQIEPSIIVPFLAIPLLIIFLILIFTGDKRSKKKNRNIDLDEVKKIYKE